MKMKKPVLISVVLLVLVAALYRSLPHSWGFAPQYSMAIFGGAVFINNKKWAFALPLISMFISDGLYEILYHAGLTPMSGFYEGQWLNYLLFALLTCIGFLIKKRNVVNVLLASISAPTVYFVLSNFLVWAGGGGYNRPKTFDGLMMVYHDGLPFYPNSLYSSLFFSTVLFGAYFFAKSYWGEREQQYA